MTRHFVKYNPAFLESDKLVENFVVRQTDLQMIVKIVRENTAASNQHVLVIGPRGSGKTTLVRRVSAEIARDEALNEAWYPLVFAEESYNALSAADFWLESLFHLAEQTRDPQRMESYHELRRDPDEKRLAQRALGQLLDYADSIGKRILLVVENLDMLLSEFSSDTEAWALRHTLMNEPRLMLLATATARFEAIDHPAKAMFEMFRIHDLRPLNDEECNTIWALVTGAPLPGLQIRPIRILTGGNARLIALVARFGEKRSFRDLLENLIDLIDEHTDYFKSHLDNMAPMERKVYLALAELWKQSSAKEIAEVARLDVNTTSAYLKRLASKGKVVVENEGKRKKWYSISEGIYNIYYLMRRRGGPSTRVKAAVRFMVGLYEPVAAVKLVLDESCTLKPEECRDHMMAIAEIYRSAQDLQRFEIARAMPLSVMESPYFDRSVRDEIMAYNSSSKRRTDEVKEIATTLDTAFELYKQKDFEAVFPILENLVAKYGDRQEVEIVAMVTGAMYNKAVTLSEMKRFGDAITTYEELIAKYGDCQKVEIVTQVAWAIVNKGVLFDELNRPGDAVKAYEELIAKYGERQEVEIEEAVAGAMVNNGIMLAQLGRFYESMEMNGELIEKYKNRQETQIVASVARAMVSQGVALGNLNRFDEEVTVYEELIEKYGERQEVEIAVEVLGAMVNKCVALGNLNRFDEEVAVYEELIEKYGERQELEITKLVANAMSNQGIALGKMNRIYEEVAAYDNLLKKYSHRKEESVRQVLFRARLLKAKALLEIESKDDALAEVRIVMNDETFPKAEVNLLIAVVIDLAVSSEPDAVLNILVESPAAQQLEPLIAGLQLYCGQEVRTAPEILEVAKDVVERIEAQKREIEGAKA